MIITAWQWEANCLIQSLVFLPRFDEEKTTESWEWTRSNDWCSSAMWKLRAETAAQHAGAWLSKKQKGVLQQSHPEGGDESAHCVWKQPLTLWINWMKSRYLQPNHVVVCGENSVKGQGEIFIWNAYNCRLLGETVLLRHLLTASLCNVAALARQPDLPQRVLSELPLACVYQILLVI